MATTIEGFFHEADKDGDGRLTISDLRGALRKYGYKGSEKQIQTFFMGVNTSSDDYLRFDDYINAMKKIPAIFYRDASRLRAFQAIDRNSDGHIDRGELQKVFARIGKELTKEQTTIIMEMVDTDASGTIDFNEFIGSVDCIRGFTQ